MSDPMTPAVPEVLGEHHCHVGPLTGRWHCPCGAESTNGSIHDDDLTAREERCAEHRRHLAAVLAARAVASDALRVRIEAHRPVMAKPAAIMCACDHEWRDVPSHAAHVSALLEDGAQ